MRHFFITKLIHIIYTIILNSRRSTFQSEPFARTILCSEIATLEPILLSSAIAMNGNCKIDRSNACKSSEYLSVRTAHRTIFPTALCFPSTSLSRLNSMMMCFRGPRRSLSQCCSIAGEDDAPTSQAKSSPQLHAWSSKLCFDPIAMSKAIVNLRFRVGASDLGSASRWPCAPYAVAMKLLKSTSIIGS